MVRVIAATVQDGVFKPDQRPALSESARVRLVVEPIDDLGATPTDQAMADESWTALRRLWSMSALDSAGDRLTRDQLHERR